MGLKIKKLYFLIQYVDNGMSTNENDACRILFFFRKGFNRFFEENQSAKKMPLKIKGSQIIVLIANSLL
jgi:hypothetical protein